LTNDLLITAAEEYTRLGFKVIPIRNKRPVIAWANRRSTIATPEELQEWFVNNSNVDGIGIILDMGIVAIETDGLGERKFNERILAKLSHQTQQAYENTTHTKSPNGHHRLFRMDTIEDNPYGTKEITCNLARNKDDHNEIKLLSHNKYIVERGPGYEKIKGIGEIATISNEQVNELAASLECFKLEINAVRTVSTNLAQYYKQPNRDNLVFALSGFLHKGGVPEYIIKDTIEFLIEFSGNRDAEREARLKVIEDTCAKDANSDQVSGYTKLLEAVENNQAVIDELQQVFGHLGYFFNAKKRSKTNGYHIPLDIVQQIKSNVYSIIGENPLTLFIADNVDKKLKKAVIAAAKRGYGGKAGTRLPNII